MTRTSLTKLPFAFGDGHMENTPVVLDSTPLLVECFRPSLPLPEVRPADVYCYVTDLRTGREVSRFGEGHSFPSAYVDNDELHAFAVEYTDDWTSDIYRFSTRDLKEWRRELAISRQDDEHLFNSSVCRDDGGYVMAYESNLPVQFCFKFARSRDLSTWKKEDGLVFTGTGGEYSACPVIRYCSPYYYVIYLHRGTPGHEGWISYLARSRDLVTWELCPNNPILEAGSGEGINNSDVDLFEFEGNTYVFYATGDQATWGTIRVAMYAGPMREFLEGYYPEEGNVETVSARR